MEMEIAVYAVPWAWISWENPIKVFNKLNNQKGEVLVFQRNRALGG